jgi:hypothetical protein
MEMESSLLVGGLKHIIFPYIGNIIIPTNEHIFKKGGSTPNQLLIMAKWKFLNMGDP